MSEQDATQEQAQNPIEARIAELRATAERLEAIAQKPFIAMSESEQSEMLEILNPAPQAQPTSSNGTHKSKAAMSEQDERRITDALMAKLTKTPKTAGELSAGVEVKGSVAKRLLNNVADQGMIRREGDKRAASFAKLS